MCPSGDESLSMRKPNTMRLVEYLRAEGKVNRVGANHVDLRGNPDNTCSLKLQKIASLIEFLNRFKLVLSPIPMGSLQVVLGIEIVGLSSDRDLNI